MLRLILITVLCWNVCATGKLIAEENDGFVPMFNGKDLSGWQRINTAESTWSFKDDMLICSGKPIGELRTNRMYQNFIMELEWRHMVPKGNAGVFVWADDITAKGVPFHRGIEVQVLENAYGNTKSYSTHGDIFPIHGATMKPVNGRGGQRAFPTENRSNPSPQWNHYRITCIDGDITLAVNGKVVTQGKECNPRRGYICLESEGGVVHYRNVKIKELPDSAITEDMIAIADRGYRCLYNGIDLKNWDGHSEQWQPQDWVLAYRSESNHTAILSTKEKFSDCEFLFDMKRKNEAASLQFFISREDAKLHFHPNEDELSPHLSKPGRWDRIEGTVKGDTLSLSINGRKVLSKKVTASGTYPMTFAPAGEIDFANIYASEEEQLQN